MKVPSRPSRIFLDMDGVLADFCGGAFAAFGRDPASVDLQTAVDGCIDSFLAPSREEFWRVLSADWTSHAFWEELLPYPLAHELVETCLSVAPTCVLTAPPGRFPGAAAGKMAWMKNHFPDLPYLIGRDKTFCACPGHLLIDDTDKQIGKFVAAGGAGLLWPQPWNSLRDRRQEDVLATLRKLRT